MPKFVLPVMALQIFGKTQDTTINYKKLLADCMSGTAQGYVKELGHTMTTKALGWWSDLLQSG